MRFGLVCLGKATKILTDYCYTFDLAFILIPGYHSGAKKDELNGKDPS